MAEYIKREALYKKLLELEALARARVLDTPTTSPAYQRYSAQLTERNAIRHMIAEIPAADVALVVHGRWRLVGEFGFNDCYICSECGKIAMNDSNYCPNCGSKMDKEGNKRRSAQVVAENIYFGGDRRESDGGNAPESSLPPYEPTMDGDAYGDLADDDGDLQF